MALSSEDQLRIQVLLHNHPLALRIDESRMVLHALTADGEASIPLSPNGPNEQYLRQLREMLSEHVLGSSGGYPVYIKRWSRMGQTGEMHLNEFMLLGEPEAVVAVANSPGLTIELAHRVWWAVTNTAQQAEQGIHMLRRACVLEDALGREIAQFLMEHLPFENEPDRILEILSAVLQRGLLEQRQIEQIWQRSRERGKGIYRIAFLQGRPLALPEPLPPHPEFDEWSERIAPLLERGSGAAQLLLQIGSAAGQTFVAEARRLLEQVANEESVYALLNAIGPFFSPLGVAVGEERDLGRLMLQQEQLLGSSESGATAELLELAPEQRGRILAMMFLSQVREEVAFRAVLHSGSVGRSLRRRLRPEFELIGSQLEQLQR